MPLPTIQTISVGGGPSNLQKLYENTNQLFGFNLFGTPGAIGGRSSGSGQAPRTNLSGFSQVARAPSPQPLPSSPRRSLTLLPLMQQRTSPEQVAADRATWGAASAPPDEKYWDEAAILKRNQEFQNNRTDADFSMWGSALAKNAASRSQIPKGIAGMGYIQLANILNSGQADRYGVSEDDIVAAMQTIKGQ